uniref:Lysosomal Pro-X carboxypeptidase n=1 Tax=Aegilops tauschii TaxID=37682 RepID=M8BLU0_AEGTA
MTLTVVPALLLLLLAAFAPELAAAASSSRRTIHQPPHFPAGLASLYHSSGRYAVADNGTVKTFTAHYFPQELDHFTFTPNSSRVFSQKYLLNDTFWRRKPTAGPLFVYTGNEGDIEWFTTNTGFMFDIAPEFGALLVFIEVARLRASQIGQQAAARPMHRFYGESQPFGNDSDKSADTLGYLTSTQALADFAILITSLKQNLSAVDAPVIVFGGSYGGMLASWFRLKYPHVAMGALASSAPILQFDDITPWSGFKDTVTRESESLNCFSVIKAVWDVLDDRGSNETGLLELSKTFRTCKEKNKRFKTASIRFHV